MRYLLILIAACLVSGCSEKFDPHYGSEEEAIKRRDPEFQKELDRDFAERINR